MSVNAPMIGALIKRKLERAIVHSKYAADWTEVKSFPKTLEKIMGKNAAKAVVANAELPRSYEIPCLFKFRHFIILKNTIHWCKLTG